MSTIRRGRIPARLLAFVMGLAILPSNVGAAESHPTIRKGHAHPYYALKSVNGGSPFVLDMHRGKKVIMLHLAAWDAERQSVTFAGDFKGAAPAKVGTTFRGGGGAFDLRRFPADDKARFLHSVNKGLRAMPAWEGIAKPVQIEAIWRYIGSVNGWPPEAMAGAENTAGSSQAQ